MPPLTWRNVDGPDLGSAALILQRAAGGLQEGFGGLGENFQAVHDRQSRNRSAAAMGQLAGIRGESNVDSVLAQVLGSVDPRFRTEELTTAIANSRDAALGFDNTRSTMNTRDAGNARNQETHDWNMGGLRQEAGLVDDILRLRAEGNGGLGRSASEATANILREFEGFEDTPYYDVDAHRAGYGSDTVTMADGEVVSVTPETRVSREDAERDLQRRVETEFLPRVVDAIGQDTFNALNVNQQGVLGSIAYNYGSLPDSVVAAARSGNPEAIAQAITNLRTDNDGVNANRRDREAQLFMTGGGRTSFADLVPENNMLGMDFWEGQEQDAYDDSRIERANARADREQAETDADAAEAEALAEEATSLVELLVPQMGPVNTADEFTRAVYEMEGLTPELRDAVLTQGLASITARAPLYAPTGTLPTNRIIDEVLANNAITDSINDPTTEALRSAGAFDSLTPEAASGDAGDPATDATALALRDPSATVFAQVRALVGEDGTSFDNSIASIMTTVDDVYEHFRTDEFAIPKEVIMGMVEQGLRGNENWFRNDGVYVDEERLIQMLSPIGTADAYRQMVNDERGRVQDREAENALAEEYRLRQQEAAYWEGNTAPGSGENAQEALNRMKQIDSVFREMAAPGGPARKEGVAEQEEEPVTSGGLLRMTPDERLTAIVEGEALTPMTRQERMEATLAQAAGVQGDTTEELLVTDTVSVMEQEAVRLAEEGDTVGVAILNWIRSGNAPAALMENPQLIELARENPAAFYRNYVLPRRHDNY